MNTRFLSSGNCSNGGQPAKGESNICTLTDRVFCCASLFIATLYPSCNEQEYSSSPPGDPRAGMPAILYVCVNM